VKEPLTTLEQKVADAHGLAIAATVVTQKVEERVDDVALVGDLRGMRRDAEETRARCQRLESDDQRAHAITVSERALDLAHAWFKAGTDPLSAWSYLAMGEAAEVTTWAAVTELAVQAADERVAELAAWALPLEQEHLATALRGAARLAALMDARAPRFG
jgi:hypothetical protein